MFFIALCVKQGYQVFMRAPVLRPNILAALREFSVFMWCNGISKWEIANPFEFSALSDRKPSVDLLIYKYIA